MPADQLLTERSTVQESPSVVQPMRYEDVPTVDTRYWTVMTLASVLGCSVGDCISFYLHWNHWIGLAPLTVIFVALLFGERHSGRSTEVWYWTIVIVLRAAATNLADLATHTFGWPYLNVILGLATVQALVVILAQPRLIGAGTDRSKRHAANGWYWACLLTAGTLGTAVGDCVAEELRLGTGGGTLLLGAVFAVVLAMGSKSRWTTFAAYWLAVVAVISAGTTAGDWLAFGDAPGLSNGLNLGLPVSTALTCALFVGNLLLWKARRPRTSEDSLAQSAQSVGFSHSESSLKVKPVLWFLMGLAGISVLFSTELPILRDRSGPNHLIFLTLVHDRYLFIPHALGGVLATLTGPIQFSARLRREHLQLHRIIGRIYVYSVFIAAPLAIVIAWHRPLFVGTTVQAMAWFLCTLFAVLTVRNRYVVQHRQWMIRSYAMTFTFISLRFLNFWPAYANMSDPTFNILDIIVTFLSVSVPTIAFNWSELTTKRH